MDTPRPRSQVDTKQPDCRDSSKVRYADRKKGKSLRLNVDEDKQDNLS